MTGSLQGPAGSGASFTLLGTDEYGSLTLTTGTGSSDGVIFVFILSSSDEARFIVPSRLTGLDATTKALTASMTSFDGTGTQVELTVSSGLADSTTYKWAYRVDI